MGDKPMKGRQDVLDTTDNPFDGIDRDVRPELKPGSRTAQCAECGHFFTGVSPFDRHLDYGADGDGHPVCKTAQEMAQIGMTANKYGVWQYGIALKVMQERFA